MKLKEITFTFENCECITVDGKYIGDFLVDDIHTSISRIACNAIEKMNETDTFVIEIHKDANKEHKPFGSEDYKTNVFDRINGNDITSIDFELIDPYPEKDKTPKTENYDYYVNWTGDSDYINDSQKVLITSLGNLYMVISKDKDIKDYFDIEDINSDENMDIHFDMLDVGDKYGDPDRYKDDTIKP